MELLEQHFDIAFAAPDGIKKLRELILTLAMQGRLVPQDPNDPPASQLLKEIEAEKKRLVKEGKIKTPKPLPEIKPEEVPYSLPRGWEWVRLIEIGNWTIGSGFPHSIQGDQNQKIFMCKVSDMNLPGNEKYIESANNTISEELAEAYKINIHEPGTIIFPKIGGAIATNKRRILKRKTAIDNNCLGIKPYIQIGLEWAYQLLQSFDFSRYQAGTSVPAISQSVIGEIVIGLPPLPEQNRIVTKIDQLMACCDELEMLRTEHEQKRRSTHIAALKQLLDAQASDSFANAWQFITQNFGELYAVKENVAELRKAILQLAVMGKLVPQNPNDPPAGQLLKEIEAEKKRLVKVGKIKGPKPLSEIKQKEVPYQLPSGWEWVRFGVIAFQITDGTHHTPTYIHEGIPFLSVKDMSSGCLNFSATRFISKSQHEELIRRCHPKKGDLLLTKVGTTGIPVLIETDQEFSIFVSVSLIKFSQGKISGRYLSSLFKSPLVKKQSEEGTEGVGNKNLVLRKISNFILPLPPLLEQHRIVAKIDQLIALCDTLEQQIDAATRKQTELLNAVMAQV